LAQLGIAIGPDVDAEAIEASYSHGVLTVVPPKTEEARLAVRGIPIVGS
jgi:HSP20 family molecular chaperone IbpA